MKGSLVTERKSACSFEGSTEPGSVEHSAPEGIVKFLFWFSFGRVLYVVLGGLLGQRH